MQKFVPYIAMVVIAAASFAVGAVTDIGTAFQIATNKEMAKQYCATLINGTEE